MADLVNYNNETRNVYLTWDLEYVPGIIGQDSTPNLMSVTGCKMAQPNLNKTGRAVTLSKNFPVLIDGTIISAKGHMHNGGEAMVMSLNGKEICRSVPNYIGDNIQGMSDCRLNIPVRVGDAMQLESIYDLAAHPLRKEVGGTESAHDMMGGDDVMGMATLTVSFVQGVVDLILMLTFSAVRVRSQGCIGRCQRLVIVVSDIFHRHKYSIGHIPWRQHLSPRESRTFVSWLIMHACPRDPFLATSDKPLQDAELTKLEPNGIHYAWSGLSVHRITNDRLSLRGRLSLVTQHFLHHLEYVRVNAFRRCDNTNIVP